MFIPLQLSDFRSGAPGESRTPDLLVRSQTLYPAELRARNKKILTQTRVAHLLAEHLDSFSSASCESGESQKRRSEEWSRQKKRRIAKRNGPGKVGRSVLRPYKNFRTLRARAAGFVGSFVDQLLFTLSVQLTERRNCGCGLLRPTTAMLSALGWSLFRNRRAPIGSRNGARVRILSSWWEKR